MKSGQGRLLLRDGTDVPLEYRIAHQEFGSRCQGSVIGDLSSVNPGIFAERLQFVSSEGMKVALLVTNYSDSHLTFIGDYGGPAPGKVEDLTSQAWMDAFALHVHPVFHLFKASHPHLAKEGGAVLLISSAAGLRGCPGTVAYQTVKGALIPLAKALAFDHGHENIRVNLLTPGIIRTRFHAAMTDQAEAHNLGKRIPLRREGSVEDVAFAALQMIQNEFITGEYLTIDGGMSMRMTG